MATAVGVVEKAIQSFEGNSKILDSARQPIHAAIVRRFGEPQPGRAIDADEFIRFLVALQQGVNDLLMRVLLEQQIDQAKKNVAG